MFHQRGMLRCLFAAGAVLALLRRGRTPEAGGRRGMKWLGVIAAGVVAPVACGQVTFVPGAGGFQDITGLPGTINLGLGLGQHTTITTTIGNEKFPEGVIKIGYNGTIGSNVDTSISTDNHQPIPTVELYEFKTAFAVIWDTPDPEVAGTAVLFREFFEDPGDVYYIVQWNNLPMGGAGGTATFQVRINDESGFRQQFYGQLSYFDVHAQGIEGGVAATIGYQSDRPEINSVQWSFNQRFAVQNGMDLFLVDIPSPGGAGLLLMACAGAMRRRRR